MDTIAYHYSAWCETYRIFGKEFISEEEFKISFQEQVVRTY